MQDCSISIANSLESCSLAISHRYDVTVMILGLYSPSWLEPRDSCLDFFNHSEIWQAPRQQRCRDACQISKRYDHNSQSDGFEISRHFTLRWITTKKQKWCHFLENLQKYSRKYMGFIHAKQMGGYHAWFWDIWVQFRHEMIRKSPIITH